MGNIPRTRIGWYGLVYNIIFCLVEISLESHILVDGKLPIGNSNRELQGSRVYFCIIIVYPLSLDNGGKHVSGVSHYAAFVCALSSCNSGVRLFFINSDGITGSRERWLNRFHPHQTFL